jgi:hypothetical protein
VRPPFLASSLIVVLSTVTLFGCGGGGQSTTAASAPPADLLSGLASTGKQFIPVSTGDAQAAKISPQAAEDAAAAAELGGSIPKGVSVNAYLGRLTEEDRLEPPPNDTPDPTPADANIPPPAMGQLAYAVQLEGVNEYPRGGDVTDLARVHHELIVFIDAETGKPIVATTFR